MLAELVLKKSFWQSITRARSLPWRKSIRWPFLLATSGSVLLALLAILLVTGIGVLVSLHAGTVRQAYQRMSLGFLLVWLPIMLGPQFLPAEWKIQLSLWLENVNGIQLAGLVGIILLMVDLFVIVLARARFQRARLILD